MEAERQSGLLGGRPEAIPGGIAGIDGEDVDDRAPVTLLRDSLELGDGRLRRGRGQEREGTEPVGSKALNSSMAQSFHAE